MVALASPFASRSPMTSDRLRVVIADDEPIALRAIARLLAADPTVDVIAACATGGEALAAIRERKPDVAFLDVALPDKSGLDVVRELVVAERPVVVFVTAHDTFAIEAFNEHAVDYLLKPFDEDRLRIALDRARERVLARDARSERLDAMLITMHQRADHLACKRGDTVVFVPLAEIDWCESADNYVRVHGAQRPFLIRETLRSLERRTRCWRFSPRIGRAFRHWDDATDDGGQR
jgi:two-component system, LytTR family, response regulator